ncbi:SUMF1/EgtB/PvdO family nonheme iron enzyme [uncultured Thiodictyon sp.]|jgi:formylglycine-generating enzyme required for sulfatase activity|uniref:NACHT domain-containing protein n=1 Tax=uncultured Thiodictyon sp. TaxID=1846217 RepID=UPI0025F744F6|nr:SUMF1/EgtB/PvdO family nonheme iron enzyme [uncultured Thiodictyon sp.]
MTAPTTGNVTASNGSVAIAAARQVQITVNNIAVPPAVVADLAAPSALPPAQAHRVAADLLDFVERFYRYLPLKGMGPDVGMPRRFPLVDIFVPLGARLILPQADTLSQELRVAGRAMAADERAELGGRADASRPVLELIRERPVLVVLGDPGSGKSTLLKYIAFAVATGQAAALGLAGRLPLLLPLAAYAECLDADPALSLRRFAVQYFHDFMDLDGLEQLLAERLEEGRVLLLLDGLDEVRDPARRNTVVDRVQSFLCRHCPRGTRVILTSRIVGYREVRPPQVEDLRECTLLDFEDAEIAQFIRRWTAVVERILFDDGRLADYAAAREAADLLAAVQGNPGVGRLASNPLLLTMLVIQKRNQVSLPRQRVLLYEQYIQSLLRDWLLARSPQAVPRALPNERALRRVLEPLALWMQGCAPGLGRIGEQAMLTWLREHHAGRSDPEQAADDCLRDVREHSGLLIDRGGRQFGFLHLTFMEYLAGAALAAGLQAPDGQRRVVETLAAHAGDAQWRETLLLTLGYVGLQQRQDIAATALLNGLLDAPEGSPGLHAELAAAALADIGEDGVTPEGWVGLRGRLVAEGLTNPRVPAARRVLIGEHLAVAGDPRRGVLELDAMEFCRVPAGSFLLGATDGEADDDEKKGAGPHRLDYPYWLARFPLTVAQFSRYLDESGRTPGHPDCRRGHANTPVVWVYWDEAVACADWLTERWRVKGWLPAGWRVALPSEPEWEKAAKGGERIPSGPGILIRPVADLGALMDAEQPLTPNPNPRRPCPWGIEPDSERMNFAMYIGRVSPVGCYPEGLSPYGCEDLSGNVWEWTRSRFAAYPYPDDAKGRAAREDRQPGVRGARGGAFSTDRRSARSSSRLDRGPEARRDVLGFRLVVAPFLL